MKNKVFIGLFIVNILLAIADLALTLAFPHNVMFESNPLYTLFKSFWLMLGFNVVIFGVLLFCYLKSKLQWFRYLVIQELVLLVILRIMALKSILIDWMALPTKISTQITAFVTSNSTIVEQTQLQTQSIQTQIVTYITQHPEIVQQTQVQMMNTSWIALVCGFVAFILWYIDWKMDNKTERLK